MVLGKRAGLNIAVSFREVDLQPCFCFDIMDIAHRIYVHIIQGGPLPVINGVIAPINGLINE